ncbi:MAG: DUF3221 domain-containing protein [Bulleidia sp.]
MSKILFSAAVILLCGCMPHKETLTGVVQEVHESSILIAEKTNGTLYSIRNENNPDIHEGDSVTIIYDGTVLESYPAQINHVYQITIE